ncbi:MAG: WD40 repeat domain-containing protein [Pseudomonadota bacterium]
MKKQISRRGFLVSAGAVSAAGAGLLAGAPFATAVGSAPRAVGIADFVFGVGASDGALLAMNGWTGDVVTRIASPVEMVSIFANRTTERIVGIDAGAGKIVVFRNPGETAEDQPLVYRSTASPDLFTFAPDGRHAVYADFGTGELVLMDVHNARTVRTFHGFEGVHDIRFSGLTEQLTVTSLDRADVRTVDVETGDVGQLVQIPDPEGRGIDHMSQTLSGRTGIIIQPGIAEAFFVRISADGGELARSICLSSPPLRAFISSDNRYALLPSTQEPVIDIVDLDTLVHVKTLLMPGLVTTMQTDPISPHMVAIAPDTGSVLTINTRTQSVVSNVQPDGGADMLALNEESGLAFVLANADTAAPTILPVRAPSNAPQWQSSRLRQPMWTLTSTNALAVCH